MKKYRYERVSFKGIVMAESKEHRAVIDRMAAQGWRYAGFFPASMTAHGAYDRVDLIFERDA